MIKSCKKILTGLRKLADNSDDLLAFLHDTTCICLAYDTSKTYDYSKYEKEIESVIKQLVEDGYLEYSINEYHFTLTQRGLHPYRFRWETIKEFLLKSILVPIVVSLITAVLTVLIQSWLTQT